ncbi:MAG: TonB-dependent receptor [Tenuifilaceae bacterium]|jgi:TonB-linked SusC/RagA family outer membrane protein|nr:TonB-dependent receptor [Tenuifilaceae bacterium]
MHKKILIRVALLCFVALGVFVQVFAQETITVTGVVYDESNAAVTGASIVVKGTTIGVTSDEAGKFTIQVPATAKFLVVSFVGMEALEVPISKEPMTIVLVASSTDLEEVVFIGYGTVRKSQVTSSISSVNQKDLKNLRVTGIDQAIQGKLSGVTVTNNSGQPGGGVALRVRGLTTINSNDPLIVIDGVPFTSNTVSSSGYDGLGGGRGQTGNSFLANINPDDIETIDVLKDASAQAIYGSQAANGVIMITTKKGKAAEGKITYDHYSGFSNQAGRLELMNLRQFAEYQNEVLPIIGNTPVAEFQDPSILGEGTDWQEAIFKNGFSQNHSLSFSASRDNLSYYISAGYLDQEGTLEGSDFKRFSARFNLDHQVKRWMSIGMTSNITRSTQNVALADNAPSGTIWLAAIQSPLTPIKNIDGSWGGGQTVGDVLYYQENPVAQSQTRGNRVTQNQIFGNLYADIKFLKDFSFKSEVSYTLGLQNNLAYQYGANIGPRIQKSTMIDNRQNSYYWALRNYLNYNKTFGKHFVAATAGHEAQYSYWESINGRKLDLQNNILDLNAGSTDSDTWELGGGKGNWAMESFFARGNYMFDNKYSITASYRADASSNFGPNNKWGYFTGVSLGWTITNEAFMESLNGILPYAKLRLGYGSVGNQNLPGGAASPPYTSGVMFWQGPVGFGTVGSASSNFINGIANPDLGWEKVITTNAGLDLGFLKNRLEASVDVYKKVTTDMLLFTTGPTFLGIGSNWDDLKAPIGNVGQMTNTGFDVSLTSHNFVQKDFSWTTSLIVSRYKNVLDRLLNETSSIDGRVYYSGYTVTHTAPGQSVGSFYGLVYDGIYRTQEDLDNALPQFGYGVDPDHTWFGDVRYKDINGYDANGDLTGEPDGKIDAADLTYIGSPIPDFTFGFTNNLSYKNFDFSIFLQGSYGADIFNFLKWQLEKMDNAYYNQLATVADRYSDTNTEGSLPRFTNTNTNNTYISSRYVEDGSYLRIQNISLGYRLPASLIRKVGLANLRVYMSMQNVYTFTKYSGYDPEIGSHDNTITLMNVDLGHYPNPRIFTFGINCEF